MTYLPKYPSYHLGLDLGQSQDYSALSIIEEPIWIADERQASKLFATSTGWVAPGDVPQPYRYEAYVTAYQQGRPLSTPPLRLRHLERFPLGTSYPAIVTRVAALMVTEPLRDSAVLVIDHTGVGRPVADLFALAGLPYVAITIHGGEATTWDGRNVRVSKRNLVGATQAALQSQRLQIAPTMPLAKTLTDEFLSFKAKINLVTGHDSYEAWREKDHDDLVLSVSMAIWLRDARLGSWDRTIERRRREDVSGETGARRPRQTATRNQWDR